MQEYLKYFIILLIKIYKLIISPLLHSFGLTGGCRFRPTCSEYTVQMIKKHGAIAGLKLGLRQMSQCHPWGK
jgi:hypothetical protein